MKFNKIIVVCFLLSTIFSYLNNAVFPRIVSLSIFFLSLIIFISYFIDVSKSKLYYKKEVKYISLITFFFLAYALVSLIWSQDQMISLRYIYFLFLAIGITPILSQYIKSTRSIIVYCNIIILLTIVEVVIGLFEFFLGIHVPNSRHYSKEFYYTNPFIPTGTFYNENNYAASLSIGFVFILLKLFEVKRLVLKLLYFLVILMIVLLILETSSRISLVSLVLSFSFVLFLILNNKNIIIIFLVLIMPVIILLIQSDLFYSPLELFSNMIETDMFENDDSVDFIRLYLVKISLNAVTDSYFMGLGPGGFEEYCEGQVFFELRGVCNPHNWIMEVAANFGILPAIFQIVFIILIFKGLYSKFKSTAVLHEKNLLIAFLGALPSVLLASVSLSSVLQFSIVWIYFSYSIALINTPSSNVNSP